MTVRTLVNRAHRYLKTYGSGETPSDDDGDIGLEELKALLRQMIAKGVFGPITDVAVTEDYEAGENERVNNLSASAITVTMPSTIEDAVTGEDRAPEDRAVVIVPADSYNIYDANQGEWVEVEALTLNSVEPFYAFNLGWLLAEQMSESFHVELGPIAKGKADTTRAALRLKRPIRVTAPTSLLHMHANGGRWMR
jgi:hypothetical protein